jgi:hypothetical protein
MTLRYNISYFLPSIPFFLSSLYLNSFILPFFFRISIPSICVSHLHFWTPSILSLLYFKSSGIYRSPFDDQRHLLGAENDCALSWAKCELKDHSESRSPRLLQSAVKNKISILSLSFSLYLVLGILMINVWVSVRWNGELGERGHGGNNVNVLCECEPVTVYVS